MAKLRSLMLFFLSIFWTRSPLNNEDDTEEGEVYCDSCDGAGCPECLPCFGKYDIEDTARHCDFCEFSDECFNDTFCRAKKEVK